MIQKVIWNRHATIYHDDDCPYHGRLLSSYARTSWSWRRHLRFAQPASTVFLRRRCILLWNGRYNMYRGLLYVEPLMSKFFKDMCIWDIPGQTINPLWMIFWVLRRGEIGLANGQCIKEIARNLMLVVLVPDKNLITMIDYFKRYLSTVPIMISCNNAKALRVLAILALKISVLLFHGISRTDSDRHNHKNNHDQMYRHALFWILKQFHFGI